MDVNQGFVYKSLNARKQNPYNKPGNFTTRFTPEVILDDHAKYYLALDHISVTGQGGQQQERKRIQGFSKAIYLKLNSITNTATIK